MLSSDNLTNSLDPDQAQQDIAWSGSKLFCTYGVMRIWGWTVVFYQVYICLTVSSTDNLYKTA